ncbi:GLPGLI family protein [Prevotella sp. HUN102]|uniref:GLPGLI family protein n=1 Tax=Prevotella sp. HUN102 TaxID=1392486 RepID=UPI0009DF9565|nr:GLPGLI family protein [Prevotella sp. HUN102]
MKHLSVTILFLLMCNFLFAQSQTEKGVKLTYLRTLLADYAAQDRPEWEDDKMVYDTYYKDGVVVTVENTEKSEPTIKIEGLELYRKIDFINNTTTYQPIHLNTLYLIKDDLPPIEWEITDESKQIGGWNCTRAIRKDNKRIEAWFTTDLPFTCGPYDCYGLPGLVVSYKRYIFLFTLQEINTMNEELPEEPKTGKIVSRAKYEKIEKH